MEIKFTILGCGYSLGIPRIDGSFGNCDPKNKINKIGILFKKIQKND